MRSFFLFSLLVVSVSPALAMSTKEKVRMILWVNGIKEKPKQAGNVYSWPEEIEKPLRKF